MVQQPTGYRAFIPALLPPDPPIQFDQDMVRLLAEAERAVGRLDGATQFIPNPNLFVAMYVRREAVLSSQIEGTQSSLDDILAYELNPNQGGLPHDVDEVVNYVQAMNYGLQRLDTLPLSLRLLREIHGILLDTGRVAEKHPGEFRTSQNWIGPANVPLSRATFVPPPPFEMRDSLDNLERFLHDEELPALIHAGIAHAQFETIHPFLDGNGRVGRLLMTLLLCHRGVLEYPLLYLSYYLKLHRAEYYDRLSGIRLRGDWEGWLRYFLHGVIETAEEATRTARSIIQLRNQHLQLVQEHGLTLNGFRLLDLLFATPFVNSRLVVDRLDVVPNTANRLLSSFVELELLEETTGQKRSRVYRYKPYLALFDDPEPDEDAGTSVETTETDSGNTIDSGDS
jgi:Fic family protein